MALTESARIDFGKVSEGSDITAPLVRAVAAAAVTGGVVQLPAGDFTIQPSTARTTVTTQITAEGHAIVIPNCQNVAIVGAGKHQTRMTMLGFGGANLNTTWQTVSGKVWRGAAFFLAGGAGAGSRTSGITFRGFTLSGGTSYTGNAIVPADTGTGDGWDITHKGIWLQNGAYFGDILIEDCELFGFRGEVVYAGASDRGQLQKVTGRRLSIHDTNGDCWSVTGAEVLLEDCDLYRAAGNGVEDNSFDVPCTYRGNRVSDIDQHGIWVAPGTLTGPFGRVQVVGNRVTGCLMDGVLASNPQGVDITDNTIIDCAPVAPWSGIDVAPLAGYNGPFTVRGARVERNTVIAATKDVELAVRAFDEGGAPDTHLVVRDNHCELTATAAASGKTFTRGYNFDQVTDPLAILGSNSSRGATYAAADSASIKEQLLTTTSPTDVAQRLPKQLGNCHVLVYFRVATAPTDVTITLSWFDVAGVQSQTLVAGSQTVGSHTVTPVVVAAVGGHESRYVKVTVTAGTASRVYVSAQVAEVATF